MGLIVVNFNDEATRDHVLENGIIQFDRKPVIIRPWTTDLSAVRLVRSVLLWIRLQDLGLQYWGSKCLSALVSIIGKPIMVDKYTRERSRIQFTRVLVEMEVTDNPPTSIQYINEHGQIMEQGVEYEWLPIKCKNCTGFGHSMTDCRKTKNAQWVMKETKLNKDEKAQSSAGFKAVESKGTEIHVDTDKVVDQTSSEEVKTQTDKGDPLLPDKEVSAGTRDINQASHLWHTPKKVAAHSKEGQGSGKNAKVTGQTNKSLNKFIVLQEDRLSGKVTILFQFLQMDSSNIMSWNVRGLNGINKHGPISDLCKSPEIEGRLLIVWRKSFVKVTILEESNQFIHCLVKLIGVQQSFGVTFVYGMNSIEGRRSLWEGLRRPFLKDTAWIYLGDFNAPFTARIYTKIDHVLINEKWVDLFPQATAMFSWEAFSDSSGSREAGNKDVSILQLLDRASRFSYSDKIGDLKVKFYKAKETFQVARLQAQAYPDVLDFQEAEKEVAEAYSKRKAENGIVYFIAEDGKMVDNFSDVVSHYVGHFRDFLGSSSSASGSINTQIVEMGPQLSVLQQMKLLKPFSRKEIREALFSIPITKSPGSDGFGSGFFIAVWNDIGDEVCEAITHCFESGIFPSELHETTLSLIPKVANPSRAVDYRPIACFSTLYKCMSKLICKRLANILPDLIQPNQQAFVKGRSIAHNIMIFQDLIKNYGRATTSSRCAIKIDLRKAYDMVDWVFLENLLKALKFPMKFIGWVMACVRNTSYFLLMNGRIQGKFKGGKGLR
ncbi:uncharacterized protein LOC133779474 [Humulus lupulus]|uniref:uncharacterized protein LOC133779474 n=1 Tax=Humulus lupulus TaxID=3486 RepID=UPI002B40B3A7|nr:uncharacterized protein LOC133779474 [Humulus lupulus]